MSRSRSNTVARNNFRPIAYSTQQELDVFFGLTSGQKRELNLRSKDEDGRIWFDSIEREEWRALLQSTPRRGSGETWSLDSPRRCSLGAPAVCEASTPGPSFSFPDTITEEDEQRRSRPMRPQNNKVYNLLSSYTFAPPEKEQEEGIYISRLPLARRKVTPALLEQAFTPNKKARPAPLNLKGKKTRPHSVIGISPPPTSSYNLTQPGNRGTFGGDVDIHLPSISPMQEILESPQPSADCFVDLQPKRTIKFTASHASLRSNFTDLESDPSPASEKFVTPLAPRTGARKASPTPPPIKEGAKTAMGGRYKVSAGLRTGEEVYQGVDIPCPSIYLDSDESGDEASVAPSEESASGSGSSRSKKKEGKVKKWFSSIVAKT